MPLRPMILRDEAHAIGVEIKHREDYISVLELENLRLRLRLNIIGGRGLIIWSISLIVAGLASGVSPVA